MKYAIYLKKTSSDICFMKFRIVNCNINGFHSAFQKGFWNWFTNLQADVLCVQECRNHLKPQNCPNHWVFRGKMSSQNKGKGGVGIFTKHPYIPIHVQNPIFNDRVMILEIYGIRILSVYAPTIRFEDMETKEYTEQRALFWKEIISLLQGWKDQPFLLCGDLNLIASEEDIHPSLRNLRKSIITSDTMLMQCILEQQCFDVWRQKHPNTEAYSFWSFRNKQLFTENRGVRLDYQIASHHFEDKVISADMPRDQIRISDHSPVIVDYDIATFYEQWKQLQIQK